MSVILEPPRGRTALTLGLEAWLGRGSTVGLGASESGPVSCPSVSVSLLPVLSGDRLGMSWYHFKFGRLSCLLCFAQGQASNTCGNVC